MDSRNRKLTEEGRRRRLTTGLDRLEEWSHSASQAQRNAVYKALFSVLCGSVFRAYPVLSGDAGTDEFVVFVKADLVLRIRFRDPDSFGITYIGAPFAAADQGQVA